MSQSCIRQYYESLVFLMIINENIEDLYKKESRFNENSNKYN